MPADKVWRLLGVSVPFDPTLAFVSSPALSPSVLAVLRLTFGVYTFATLLFVLIWKGVVTHDAKTFFSYFTELTNIGLCAYFWASGVQTAIFAFNCCQSRQVGPPTTHEKKNPLAAYPLQRWPKGLQFLHTLLWTTVTTFPFLVTVVFWALLAGPSTFDTRYNAWENVSLHALNSAFGLFEILVTSVGPQPWLHILFLVLILGGYLGVAYITHATQGFYPYSFLDPRKEGALLAAYIVGIPAASIVVFSIVRFICQGKMRLLARSEREDRNGVEMTGIEV